MEIFKKTIWSVVIIAVAATAMITAVSIKAATLIAANDYPSTLQAGQSANHLLIFTSSSGAAEGQAISVEFASEFDVSSLIEDDVDLQDDGTDITTAPDCSGSEQASVAIAANVLSLTICPGDGGAIAPGSEVTVKIGTNANYSGTGVNQIVNPSSPGTYFISVAGTFGDSGSIALPIVSQGSMSVSATVSTGGGGGGGSPPPPSDTTPPVISNIVVSGITSSSAVINWNTNEAADSRVNYGQTTAYEAGSLYDSSLITAHSLTLTGLAEGALYHFQIISRDVALNQAVSADYTFQTLDQTAPIISNIQAVDITTSSARITWQTNEPATSTVDYGLTTVYSQARSESMLVTSHSLLLTGLIHSSTYHFQVRSQDASGNAAASANQTFTTVNDLPPANVSGVSVISGNRQNALSWTNPPDADLAGVRLLVCPENYPVNHLDAACQILSQDRRTSFTHSGLVNDRSYYYGLFAFDEAGQFASGALGLGMPSAPEEELPLPAPLPEPEPVLPGGQEGFCGDGYCADGESPDSCPADCGPSPLPPQDPVCGNAVCQAGEDFQSCPDDCPPARSDEALLRSNLEFFVANGAIKLVPNHSGAVQVLSGRPIKVRLLRQGLDPSIERVAFSISQDIFLMAPNFHEDQAPGHILRAAVLSEDAYLADFITPPDAADYPAALTIFYQDQTSQSLALNLNVQGPGYLFSWLEGTMVRPAGAKVTLFQSLGGLVAWDGSPYGQFNPVFPETGAAFAWYVPNGNYVVRAEASGYVSVETPILAVNNIVNPAVQMSAVLLEELPPEAPEEQEEIAPSPVLNVLPGILQDGLGLAGQTLSDIRKLPGAQEAAQVSVPVLAVSAAAGGLVLGASFNLLPFLQYLFTAPILFIGRRRRRGFGVVYNSVSKIPVDLAIVRLYRLAGADPSSQARLISSRVTDKGGRYFFPVSPGFYRLSVVKTGFVFPSDYLKGTKVDADFLDIYHGEIIEATEKDAVIAANLPVDPSQAQQFTAPAKIVWRNRLRAAQNFIAAFGLMAAVVFAIIRPSLIALGIILLQASVYLLTRRLAAPRQPKNWGIVYDSATNRPLSRVIARIFEPKYNKLLETRVTDGQGRFSFLLGPNEYYAVFEKPGYAPVEIRPIDYSANREPAEFGQKIKLSPAAR